MASRLFAFILTCCLVPSSLSFAQSREADVDEANTAAARALFAEGVQLAEAGDHAAAADRFERALSLRWAAPIAYNLADSLGNLGRFVEASELLHAVERADAPPEIREAARIRREELAPNVGRLRVALVPDEAGLEIRVDGRVLPTALHGMAFPADPGAREVTVHRGAQEAGRATATVTAGAESRVEVAIAPPLPSPEELAAEEERRRVEAEQAAAREAALEAALREETSARRRRRLGGALGAVGAVVLASVAIGLVVALRPEADPRIDGNFDPPRLEGRVEGVMP